MQPSLSQGYSPCSKIQKYSPEEFKKNHFKFHESYWWNWKQKYTWKKIQQVKMIPAACNKAVEYDTELKWHVLVIYPSYNWPKLHNLRHILSYLEWILACDQSWKKQSSYHPGCQLHRGVILFNFILNLWPRSSCITKQK